MFPALEGGGAARKDSVHLDWKVQWARHQPDKIFRRSAGGGSHSVNVLYERNDTGVDD